MIKPAIIFSAVISSLKRRTFSKKQSQTQRLILFLFCSAVFASAYLYEGLTLALFVTSVVFVLVRWAHLGALDIKEGLIFSMASIFTSVIFIFSKGYLFVYEKALKNIKKVEFFPEFPYHEQTFTKSMTREEINLRDGFWGPKLKRRYSPSPNSLTIIRFIGALTLLLFLGLEPAFFIGVTLVLFLTDYFDGIIARTQDRITVFGTWADPIADRVLLVVFLLYFYFRDPVFWNANIINIAIPEIILISSFALIYLLRKQISTPKIVVWGRFKCASYFFAIFAIVIGQPELANLFIVVGVSFALISIPSYLSAYYTEINNRSVFHGALTWFSLNSNRIRFELEISPTSSALPKN